MKPLQWSFDYPDTLEEFFNELLGMFTSQMPFEVMATFFFGTIALASFIRTDSPIIPLGFIMLTGASAISLMAPIGAQVAIFVVIVSGAGFMTLAWYIYSE